MKKKLLTIFLMASVLFTAVGSTGDMYSAQAAVKYSNLAVAEGADTRLMLTPGATTNVIVPVKSVKDVIFEPKFEVVLPEGAPFEVTGFKVFQDNGWNVSDYSYIGASGNAMLSFSVITKETAKIGNYDFKIRYEDWGYSEGVITEGDKEYLQSITFTGIVREEKIPAEFAVSDMKVTGDLKPGGIATVSFKVTNSGELEAKNVCLSGDYSAGQLIPQYTTYTRKLGDLKTKDSAEVSLKVKVLENVTQGMVQLPLVITYKDSEGASYTASSNNILYLEVDIPKEEETTFENGTLLVNGVKQSPSKPKAGDRVSLTFNMENTGERDYTDTKLYVNYVSGTGFEPVSAEPYQYVGTIKAGQKKSVTVNVIAGKDIAEGMNTLTVDYEYKDGHKAATSDSVTLYVLNVQKEENAGLSKPKLMVSEFSASSDVVKSGEEFDFTFSVYNTHSETAAKNIKVTVTSEMFSVTKGSNSFFMPVIAPGESEQITINLKASAAAMTGSYPVDIRMEYEYDGMPVTEANAGGVEVTETKMLLIKENLRVSVENVTVGGWNTPYVDQPTQLAFSVYNMGKSQLNNVYFTVEGDFEVANGSSYYYGTLQAGYPDYVEMDITPLAAGDVTGKLIVHMEDSNGDEVTYETEITGYVMEESGGDIGLENPGFDFPVDVPPVEEPQKPLVSLPVFIVALIAVFLVSFFTARGIRIACYKKKLRKEE